MGGFFPFGFPYSNYYGRRFSPYQHQKNLYQSKKSCPNSANPCASSDNFSNSQQELNGDREAPSSNRFKEMCPPLDKMYQKETSPNVPVWEIWGIKLYSDDILIMGLLFFLYTEGVKDEMLFICLILLLLG